MQGANADTPGVPDYEVGPCPERKILQGRLADIERSPTREPWRQLERRKQRGSMRNQSRAGSSLGRRLSRFDGGQLLRHRAGYERSRPQAAFQIACGKKLGIGIQDGNPGDSKLESQGSRGRNLLAGA